MQKRIIIRTPFPTEQEVVAEYGITKAQHAFAKKLAAEILSEADALEARARRKKPVQKKSHRVR
jgi:hypothetical protein